MKLAELTKDETSADIGLRVYVYSGGCSGYRYGMMLEDQPTADDNVLHANGVRVYIDANSVPLIKGSEIDYVDTLMGAGLHRQQPECGVRLRLRIQLPHRGRGRVASLLLPLTLPFRRTGEAPCPPRSAAIHRNHRRRRELPTAVRIRIRRVA